jgi:hydroxyacylglutathione hydrolase
MTRQISMPLDIRTIPCLADNYAFLAHDPETGATALIDVPESEPIISALEDTSWSLTDILITHHHWDHTSGLAEVLAKHPARVIGSAADSIRLPPLDLAVSENDSFQVGSETFSVIDVSGHTINHLAFFCERSKAVFTADSLMALGCGRVFEGTKSQMWKSLKKLMALPSNTLVYSGHEYTAANAEFALTIDAENPELIARINEVNQQRASGLPTVPSRLSLELSTNPFLRASDPKIQNNLAMIGANPQDVFTEIRNRKDNF